MTSIRTALAAGLILLGSAFPAMAAGGAAPGRTEIEGIVRDYLVAHPEVIEEALAALQDKHQADQKARQAETIAGLAPKLFSSEHQAILGNPDGKVTLVEFFDYNCGYCRRAESDLTALIEANPDLRVVMKEFPILSEGSVEAARVSVAVEKLAPQSYGQFHTELFARPGPASGEKAMAVAKDLGLDGSALTEAANRKDVTDNFIETQDLARALGISGTPSYVIGGEVVPGAIGYDALKQKVASVRTCGASTC